MVNYLCVPDRPYKIRTQVFGFYMPVTVTSGILAMEFGEHLSFDKESECSGGRAQIYTGTPLFLISLIS